MILWEIGGGGGWYLEFSDSFFKNWEVACFFGAHKWKEGWGCWVYETLDLTRITWEYRELHDSFSRFVNWQIEPRD